MGSLFYQIFAELIDGKIKDVEIVVMHGGIQVAVCCLDLHDFVVEVWVEDPMLLTMKVPCINFEGACNRHLIIALSSGLLGTPVGGFSRQATRVKKKGVGITATIHYQQSDSGDEELVWVR